MWSFHILLVSAHVSSRNLGETDSVNDCSSWCVGPARSWAVVGCGISVVLNEIQLYPALFVEQKEVIKKGIIKKPIQASAF